MKTIDIHGKPYVMVKDRLKYFHDTYPKGCIKTKMLHIDEKMVVFSASVWPDIGEQERFFTGHAEEHFNSSQINSTSAVENCETSAMGRALGTMAIGVDESFASADEVANAVFQQKQEDATGITQNHAQKVEMDKYATGETTAVQPDASKTSKNSLKCPNCKKSVLDQRVEEIDGSMVCPKSKKGIDLPAFKCEDNDDMQNPTCKFVSWKLTPEEAGVIIDDDKKDAASKKKEDKINYDRPLAAQ